MNADVHFSEHLQQVTSCSNYYPLTVRIDIILFLILVATVCYVHIMNKSRESKTAQFRSFQILGELSSGDELTQRGLSKRLDIALGLVNSYLKNLIKKGYVKATSLPSRKYMYLLTPSGLAEKTRLTYDLFQGYNRIYREARSTLKTLFAEIEAEGVRKVVFAGADEVAEIAYISLQETNLELSGVVDGEMAGKKFFGNIIKPCDEVDGMDYDRIVVTTYWRARAVYDSLVASGVDEKNINAIFML